MEPKDSSEMSTSALRIVTWNINGIRSIKDGKSLGTRLSEMKANVICIQETKVTRGMLDEAIAIPEGFTAYYAFSRRKSGYSGVATFCDLNWTPTRAEEGLTGTLPSAAESDAVGGDYADIVAEFTPEELRELDAEGRAVVTRHELQDGKSLAIINTYCPRSDGENPDRKAFKLKFHKLLELRAAALLREGYYVIIVGDINISHHRIDHCDPSEDFEESPSRAWLSHFLLREAEAEAKPNKKLSSDVHDSCWKVVKSTATPHQFIDTFRLFHATRENAFTCWNTKLNCRATNFGTRLDYILAGKDLRVLAKACDIQPEVLGSDHCPVVAEFDLASTNSKQIPSYCTKNFPEFVGKQVKLSSFFSAACKRQQPDELADESESKRAKPSSQAGKKQQSKLHHFFQPRQVNLAETSSAEVTVCSSTLKEVLRDREESTAASAAAWKQLLCVRREAPTCKGHGEPAVLRTVRKKGANAGRQFWSCARGEGKADDSEARCDFFVWFSATRAAAPSK